MRHLSLAHQLLFTDGGCADFATAYQAAHGGEVCVLWCADPRQFEAHDWPPSVPLALHAFVRRGDGTAVDAEGVRSLRALLTGFGVKRGYAHRVERGVSPDGLVAAFGQPDAGREALAASLIREHGWDAGVPAFDGALAKNFAEARRLLREMRDSRQADLSM